MLHSTLTLVALIGLLGASIPEFHAAVAEDEDFDPNNCSLYCGAFPELSVSHHLPPARGLSYGASRLTDGDPATAWVVRGGTGESLSFVFAQGGLHPGFPADSQTTGVDRLYIWNGYNKSPGHWRDHARVHVLELSVDGERVARLTLLDDPRPQEVELPPTLLHAGVRFRFTIRKLYPGQRFAETAVSEARLDGYGHH